MKGDATLKTIVGYPSGTHKEKLDLFTQNGKRFEYVINVDEKRFGQGLNSKEKYWEYVHLVRFNRNEVLKKKVTTRKGVEREGDSF